MVCQRANWIETQSLEHHINHGSSHQPATKLGTEAAGTGTPKQVYTTRQYQFKQKIGQIPLENTVSFNRWKKKRGKLMNILKISQIQMRVFVAGHQTDYTTQIWLVRQRHMCPMCLGPSLSGLCCSLQTCSRETWFCILGSSFLSR